MKLSPGLYIVRFQVGDQIEEKHLSVRPGSATITVTGDVSFATSTPLSGTRTSHEYHQMAAEQISRNVRGNGTNESEIFLFVRDLDELLQSGDALGVVERDSPATGVVLRDQRGEMVLDLTVDGTHSPPEFERNRWSGAAISLKAGTYLLGVSLNDQERLEMSICACNGWQTQVFLTRGVFASLPRPSRLGMLGTSFGPISTKLLFQ